MLSLVDYLHDCVTNIHSVKKHLLHSWNLSVHSNVYNFLLKHTTIVLTCPHVIGLTGWLMSQTSHPCHASNFNRRKRFKRVSNNSASCL